MANEMTVLSKDFIVIDRGDSQFPLSPDHALVKVAIKVLFDQAQTAFNANPHALLRLDWSVVTKDDQA